MLEHHVVIVGGGFGGLYVARSLKNAPLKVTLVDRRNFHLFQPLLYQVATGELSPANIASPLRYILKRQKNVHVLLGEAVDFRVDQKTLVLRDGEIAYDTLVVAAGSGNNFFGHPEWARFAPGLKTVEEATEIRRKVLMAFERAERQTDPAKLAAELTFVVVGAGPTGVELVGSLSEIARDTMSQEFRSIRPGSARIMLVDAVDRVLPIYPPELSAKALKALAKLGVEVWTKTFVTGIDETGLTVKRNDREEHIDSRTVLWAAGVQASPLGRALATPTSRPVERGGRLAVQPDLTLPGFPEIFVIGDLAQCAGADGKPLPGVAPVAIQQGKYVARQIMGRQEKRAIEPFRYRDYGSMATIGRAAAVADLGWVRFDGVLAWLAWLFIHLMYLVGFEDRLLVFTQWAWNYFTRNRGARLITGNHPPDAA